MSAEGDTPHMRHLRSWFTNSSSARRLLTGVFGVVLLIGLGFSFLRGFGGSAVFAGNPAGSPTTRARPVLLFGSIPPALHGAKRLGREDPSHRLSITVTLALSNPYGLTSLIANQQNPHSSDYHHYLTPKAFDDRFAPSATNVAAVSRFLSSSGLHVASISSNRTMVTATGTVAQMERVFGTTIGRYQLGSRKVYGPDRPPQIPDTLGAIVLGVSGLDNAAKLKHAASSTALAPQGPVAGAYSPLQLQGAYDIASNGVLLSTGAGQRVALYELAPYIPSDITAYRTYYSLPNPSLSTSGSGAIVNHSVDSALSTCSAGGNTSCDTGNGISEVDLDIEVVSAIAPNAAQDIYTGLNDASFADAYNQIVTDDQDAVVTTSWALCEPYSGQSTLQALDNIFAQAAAQGQTIFAASGDYGSDACGAGPYSSPSVNSPADDPYVMGVGGTTLTIGKNTSVGYYYYGSETTWNNTYGAGGGGFSAYFAQPPWQTGAGVGNSYNNYSVGAREVPDVSADADPVTGYSVYCSSTVECGGSTKPWAAFGGTSAGAPLWAGALADVNAYLLSNGASPTGWANLVLYQLFGNGNPYSSPPFHDITTGNNDVDYGGTSYQGDYPTTPCFDMATGMGSPDAWNIAQDLQHGYNNTIGNGACSATINVDLIQDGGFEPPTTSLPWTVLSAGGYPVIVTTPQAHSGAAAALLCGYANCDDRVSRTITVPNSVPNKATLTYWFESLSTLGLLSPAPPCVDHFYVTLATPDGSILSNGTVQASCENVATTGYQLETLDLTSLLRAHLGQKLIIKFRGTTANIAGQASSYTVWGVDDVSLHVY